jgi:hypothetical protein
MSYLPKTLLALTPQWQKYTVTFNDVAVASGSETVVVAELPAKAGVQQVMAHLKQSFAGGGADCTMDVGFGSSPASWLSAQSVTFSPSSTAIASGLFINNGVKNMDSPVNLTVTINNTTGDLDVLTGGSIDVYFLISSLE